MYSRMLRRYYLQEGPLPAESSQVARLTGARSSDELAAVESVLSEFFTLESDGWHQKRCDSDIARYHAKKEVADEKREAEAERQRRHRDRRAELFAALRELGEVPAFDTQTNELVTMLSRVTGDVRTPDATATQSPVTSHQTRAKKEKAAPAAPSRFSEFWSVYPCKDARAPAEKAWAKKRLDAIADKIIADVVARAAGHDRWLSGFVPNGTTYLNQERWNDPITPAKNGNPNGSHQNRPNESAADRAARKAREGDERDLANGLFGR